MAAISECGSREVHDWLGEMRPGLQWVDAGLDEVRQRNLEVATGLGMAATPYGRGGFDEPWSGLAGPAEHGWQQRRAQRSRRRDLIGRRMEVVSWCLVETRRRLHGGWAVFIFLSRSSQRRRGGEASVMVFDGGGSGRCDASDG
ncbi:hypothetical protein M0R45_015843 [Rubus argutus]|uniref:Uncharacterized protein n=1 Tax=Rubus argutus TaxID=59490 RepID=A0AAW1XQD9_RUBAR